MPPNNEVVRQLQKLQADPEMEQIMKSSVQGNCYGEAADALVIKNL